MLELIPSAVGSKFFGSLSVSVNCPFGEEQTKEGDKMKNWCPILMVLSLSALLRNITTEQTICA